MSFDRSCVLITGGSKGIGLSIAKVFARKTEHPLVLIARDKQELEEAKQVCLSEGAPQVSTISVDVTDEAAVSKISFADFDLGIVINNAGSFLFKQLKDTSAEEFSKQFNVNAFGAFNVTRLILPELEKKERGLIVNICSMGSLEGLSDSGAYAMSKHALLGYTRSLRKELLNTNIAVTAINLGQTYSTSWHDVDIKQEKLIDPEDVGKLIISLSELSTRSVVEEINLMPQGGKVAPM